MHVSLVGSEMCIRDRSGPCLSSSVADRPLRPANHRRLGRPLPHQQANGTQTHPPAINLSTRRFYPVLAPVSKSCPRLKGRSSTRYSPVRHCTRHRSDFLVRLACIRHAASVRSEPGSNSQVLILLLLIDSFLIIKTRKAQARSSSCLSLIRMPKS